MLIKLLRPFKKFAGKCIRLAYKLTYRLFKVDDKLAIFISFHGRGYSDNPKAIYEQMRQDPSLKRKIRFTYKHGMEHH